MIDHKDLLRKYIGLVVACEGYDFIFEACEDYGFNKEEQEELIRLAEQKPQ